MPVDNPTAVRFANERVRVLADKLAQAYYLAKLVQQEWYATDMTSLFPAEGGNVLDGSATDGRHVITAADVLLLITRASELTTDYEATSNAKLNTILKPAVHTD